MIDKKFKSDAVFAYVSQIGTSGLGFLLLTLITHYGGTSVYGSLATLTALSAVLINLLTFRTNESVVAFYKRGETTGQRDLCKLSLAAGFFLDFGIGVAVFILLQNLAPWVAEKLMKQSNLSSEISLYAWIVFASFIRGTPYGYLAAREWFKCLNAVNLLEQLLKTCLILTFLTDKTPLTLRHIIVAFIVSSVTITIVIYAFSIWKAWDILKRSRLNMDRIGEYARFSLNTFVSSSLKAGNQNIDTLVLSYLTSPGTVGIYAIFKQFLSPIGFLVSPITNQIYPRFVGAVSERSYDDIASVIETTNKKLRLIFLVLVGTSAICLVSYVEWMHLDLTRHQYLSYIVMTLGTYWLHQLWWSRPFSNATNPWISLKGNFLATILYLIGLYPMTLSAGMLGTASCMTLVALVLWVYWHRSLATFRVGS